MRLDAKMAKRTNTSRRSTRREGDAPDSTGDTEDKEVRATWMEDEDVACEGTMKDMKRGRRY